MLGSNERGRLERMIVLCEKSGPAMEERFAMLAIRNIDACSLVVPAAAVRVRMGWLYPSRAPE